VASYFFLLLEIGGFVLVAVFYSIGLFYWDKNDRSQKTKGIISHFDDL
jgi:hypothetical protein